jgi:hypothetical protein
MGSVSNHGFANNLLTTRDAGDFKRKIIARNLFAAIALPMS